MPLIRKRSTTKAVAANRINSRVSTGPHVATRDSPNLQHGIFAKVDPFIMRELGEDPSEYTELREEVLRSLAPQDAMERAIGEQMVNLLWRRRRLHRGEAGQQAEQRRTLTLERQQKLASEGRRAEASLQTKLVAHFGFVALADSSFKFEYILLHLRDVAAAAQMGEFTAGLLGALQLIYGSRPPLAVAVTIGFYENCVKAAAKGKEVNPAMADEVCRKLKEEVESFETLKELYYSTEINVPPLLLDSRLLLSNKDSKKLNRYDITLARQFHDALDQFMEYRRFRLTLGGTVKQAPVNVEATLCGEARQAALAEGDDGSGAAKSEEQQATLGSDEKSCATI